MFPALGWLANYRRDWLRLDLVAGLTAAAVVIPKAMAYATIAGLPMQVGRLYLPAVNRQTGLLMYYGERLNSISHLVGAVLALVGLGALLAVGIGTGDGLVITGYTVFGATLVLLFTMSTLYHSFHWPGVKRIFKLLDHVAIYLLIAGTYTPFMIVSLGDGSGPWLLGAVWGLALVGILSETFLSGRAVKVGQLVIYLGMGWLCSLDIDGLRAALPAQGFAWLLAGGIAYTAGVVFYVLDKLNRMNHAHGIWHFFVLAGATSHFIAIIGYAR